MAVGVRVGVRTVVGVGLPCSSTAGPAVGVGLDAAVGEDVGDGGSVATIVRVGVAMTVRVPDGEPAGVPVVPVGVAVGVSTAASGAAETSRSDTSNTP